MKKITLFYLLSIAVCAEKISLSDGYYSSDNSKCTELRVVRIKSNNEIFYLIGNNNRFLVQPDKKISKESIDNCQYNYVSEFKENTSIEVEEAVCGGTKKVSKSTLKMLSKKRFSLMLPSFTSSCIYKLSKKL